MGAGEGSLQAGLLSAQQGILAGLGCCQRHLSQLGRNLLVLYFPPPPFFFFLLEQQGESDSCIRAEMPPKGIRRHVRRGLVTAPFQCASAAASKDTAEKKRREGLCLWRAQAPASLFLFAYRTFILFSLSQRKHPSAPERRKAALLPLLVCFALK